ncbi:hypothetical protein DOS74_09015 [Staphylococcus felis]|uniref:Uncharacterized protein n=1 Tax=Staphylococcus felis TaxID=46127 RepID=A0AAX1RV00_9STAP|nr:hypothetical protein [Staphylococcus felis]MBH9581653.1 hypothetical protein [Staphylococcus felis]MDM8326994.1 hypothetical protein [Staphylococcus felis]MDQ7192584.1 hypothetical protein [Staphylococcus felis]REH75577.1 hypothetical protein DOS59_09705 [Staphylococcus felis]REH77549.1 hypothetical protein DOS57_06220 [Staphylococcus felis]
MKRNSKTALILLSIIVLISEFISGIPFIGGIVILSSGWQVLAFNAFIYLVILLILMFDRQNSIKPMLVIPLIGIVANGLAIVPFVGMLLHWLMFVLMIFFLFVLFVTPVYLPSKNAKVIYERDHLNQ